MLLACLFPLPLKSRRASISRTKMDPEGEEDERVRCGSSIRSWRGVIITWHGGAQGARKANVHAQLMSPQGQQVKITTPAKNRTAEDDHDDDMMMLMWLLGVRSPRDSTISPLLGVRSTRVFTLVPLLGVRHPRVFTVVPFWGVRS